jgi:hypothetical protein
VNKKMLQTQFSVRATDLAESFRSTVGRTTVGPYGYLPDMTSPEGPSTGGGVQAMQHLRLTPPAPNMPTLVVGHLNPRDGTAELRTLEHVDAICRERFRQGAPIDPTQYGHFLQSAQAFLGACGMRVSLAGPPPELLARLSQTVSTMTRPRSHAGLVLGILVAVVMAAALGAAVAASRSSRRALRGPSSCRDLSPRARRRSPRGSSRPFRCRARALRTTWPAARRRERAPGP